MSEAMTPNQRELLKIDLEEVRDTEEYLQKVRQQADTYLTEIEATHNRINAILNTPVKTAPPDASQAVKKAPADDKHTFIDSINKQKNKANRELDGTLKVMAESKKAEINQESTEVIASRGYKELLRSIKK